MMLTSMSMDAQAMATFEELKASTYQNKQIGSPAFQEEGMQCECHFDSGENTRKGRTFIYKLRLHYAYAQTKMTSTMHAARIALIA